jgi:hypothetical protein
MGGYAGQFSVGGGPTFQYMTADGITVVVASYVGGQLNAGVVSLATGGKTSVTLGGTTAPGSYQASASIASDTTTGVTTLTWTVAWGGQQGSSSETGTLASWTTP